MGAPFRLPIIGSKGGKGGGGGGETPNTLRSNARARLVEILGEGEIEGIVDGGQGIFFDRTPLQNPDGSLNFKGVTWEQRFGLPDQTHINGNPFVETPYSVTTKVSMANGPITRTIGDQNADAVRVIINIPALAQTDDNGTVTGATVAYAIDVRSSGGAWTTPVEKTLFNQKCTSPFQIAHRIELPLNGYPWDIRVRRAWPDSKNVKLQNEIYFDSYYTLVEGKFTYPFTALCYLEVDAEQFGEQIPARSYRVRGLKIKVPSNYDPIARTYSGIWNGTFKVAWTNNPAWILYDLVTNDRYGLGEFVDFARVDKVSLYQIAQYCDELVPSGFKNSLGIDILEPRYTFNGVINAREEAFKVLQQITTAFRGMAFWSLGQVFATADMPQDPVKLVVPADVIGGRFDYSGTSLRSRNSVAAVRWNDPQDFYQPAIELFVSDSMVKRFGWRQKDIQAIGCTSRGLAHRYARWVVDNDESSPETVTYRASWDHSEIFPGAILAIADPAKAAVRHGGRVASATTTVVTLDAPFEPLAGHNYSLMIEMSDGAIETRAITGFSGTNVTVSSAFSVAPSPNALWAITGTDVKPRQYRVLSVREDQDNIYTVVALFHDPQKFGRVEQDLKLDPVRYTRPQNSIEPPTNVQAHENLTTQNGVARQSILLSWSPSASFLAAGYLVTAQTPNGFENYGRINDMFVEIMDTVPGEYTFYVEALSGTGAHSPQVEYSFSALGWAGTPAPNVSHLEIFGRGASSEFLGPDCRISWRNNFSGTSSEYGSEPNGAGTGGESPFYRSNKIRIVDTDTNQVLREEILLGSTYTYSLYANTSDNAVFGRPPSRRFRFEVTVRDIFGRESAPVSLSVMNPAPDVVFPTVSPGLESIYVAYPFATDLDVVGALVWVSDRSDFDPMTAPVAYEGVNNHISLPALPDTDYWVRLALYDGFGKTSLNISPPIKTRTYGTGLNNDPPATPSKPTLSAISETREDGAILYRLAAAWAVESSDRVSYYEVELRPESGNALLFTTASTSYEWPDLFPNRRYSVRVRSVSGFGVPSVFGPEETILMPKKSTGPATPTNLRAEPSLRSVYLNWDRSTDPDFAEMEIWSASSNVRGLAQMIGSSRGIAFTHSGLETGVPVYYWIRARNTSGVPSLFNGELGLEVIPGSVGTGDIAANAVIADHIRANTITGDKIQVDTSLPATIKVGETSVTIGELSDPAALVNAKTTLIEPGRIQIAGTSTLASWRSGSDATKIEGGSIAANTVAANALQIGSRGLTIAGLQFSYDKGTNVLSWSAGSVSYVADNGTTATVAITAGTAAPWTSGTLYVGWTKGETTLTTGTTPLIGANVVPMATYRGGSNLVANYGRTLIDGENLVANSVTANQLSAGELITSNAQIAGGVITNVHLAGSISFDKLAGGTLSASEIIRIGGDRFTLNAAGQILEIRDGQSGFFGGSSVPGRVRVRLGKLGAGTTDYGIEIYGDDGSVILSSSGEGGGGGGAFASVDQITVENAAALIGENAIASTYISSLHGSKIVANSIAADQIGANQINATHLNITSLSAITGNVGELVAGILRSADSKVVFNLNTGTLRISS